MVHLILSSTKGNQGLRHFPSVGYLGLTPVRVEGVVRTKLDADLKNCQAKSLTISVRCYETRIGRVSTLQSNILVDYTQVLWSKADCVDYEQIGNLEFPFRINIPAKVAGFSTAVFVDYRCVWRVEAVLNHIPLPGVGSRQIRHFELPLIRHDFPLCSTITSAERPWLHVQSNKPRAHRINYLVNAPKIPIGPLDLISIPLHLQPLDHTVSIRSASVVIERRILLHDCHPSTSSASASSLQALFTPTSLQSRSSSSSLSKQANIAPPPPFPSHDNSPTPSSHEPLPDADPVASTSSLTSSVPTITPSTLYASTLSLLHQEPGNSTSFSSNSPNLQPSVSAKVVVNSITDTESSGHFIRDANGIWSKTLTLQWPAAKPHSRWAIGETITSELVSVKYFVRTKIVVTSPSGTESIDLAEQELLVVSTNEAERQLAVARYQELESMALESQSRSKSKSPRRSRPERDRDDAIPPSPRVASSSSHTGRSKSSTRRPHTSAGPRDKPLDFAGGAYGRSSRGQENESGSGNTAPSKRRSELVVLRNSQRPESSQSELRQQWPPSTMSGKPDRISSSSSFWSATHHHVPIAPPRMQATESSSTTESSSLSSSSYGEESETSDQVKEWEEELARIEVKSRRSSDLLSFFGRKKRPAGSPKVVFTGRMT